MRTSLYLVIALSFFAVAVSEKRDRKVDTKTSNIFKQYPSLATIPPTDLQKICQGSIVGDFQNWFNSWIIRALVDSPIASPKDIAGILKANIDNHAGIINAYINDFIGKSAELPFYSNLNFDIKISDLVSRARGILKVPDDNKYDSLPQVEGLAPKFGPFVAELPQDAANVDIDIPFINNLGSIFRAEDLSKEIPQKESDKDLLAKIAAQKGAIIPILRKIISVFAQEHGPAEYNALTTPQKEFLQVFFDNFKYLLGTDDEHRDFVITTLTAQPVDKTQSLPHSFLNKNLLEHLQGIDSKYKSYFTRDAFIVAFNPAYRLEDLNRAATEAFFSWDFFKAFNDIAFNTPKGVKESGPAAKQARKINRMHIMLYKVYTFARNDGTLQPKDKLTNIPILEKLFDWVLNTKMFDDPTIEPIQKNELGIEGDVVVNPGIELHSLFPRDKFKRYFLPLLSLICSKIPNCSLLSDKNKKPVIDKFVDFGNHDELKSKPTVASLVDPKVLDTIIQEAAVQELKDFADDLDTLGQLGDSDNKLPQLEQNVHPSDFKPDDESDEDDVDHKRTDTSGRKNVVIRKKLKTPKTYNSLPEELAPNGVKKPSIKKPEEDEKLQKNFDDKIGAKFLPKTADKDEGKKIEAQLDKFIDTIEATENDAKKNTLRKLLITFIIKSFKEAKPIDGKNPVAPLLSKTVQHLSNRLKSRIEAPRTKAFRNFLFRTLNDVGKYVPATAEDEFTYIYDLIFFIKFPLSNIVAPLVKKGASMNAEERKLVDLYGTELKTLILAASKNTLRNDFIKNNKPFGPEFLERASGIEFFSNFLDFFAYWDNIIADAKAVNADYYRVYLQFYQILSHIRRSAVQINEDPHEYVLHKIEECMDIAEAQQNWVEVGLLRGHCLFSHRKYAEVYFFYRMYLYAVKKVGQPLQQFKKGDQFNTHTRIFLAFASENSDYSYQLNTNCPKLSQEPICMSWLLYNEMLAFMRAPMMTDADFNAKLGTVLNVESIDARLNLFNGLEAAYYHNRRANMVDWARVIRIFDAEELDTQNGLGKALQFRKGDEQKFARYLIRSFKKLEIHKNENAIAKFVVSVLDAPEHEDKRQDSLSTYLLYNDRIIPFYIKVFLQFAIKDAHYERIARLLIKYGLSYNLVSINDVSKDDFFFDLYSKVSEMPDEQVSKKVHELLQAEYAKNFKECIAMGASKVMDVISDSALLDMLDGLDGFASEEQAVVEEENKAAVQVIETVHQVSTTIILPSDVDADKVAKMTEQRLRSAYSNQLDVEIQPGLVAIEVVEDEEEEGDSEGEDDEGFVDVENDTIRMADEKFLIDLTTELANKAGKDLKQKIESLMNNNEELDALNLPSTIDSAHIQTPEALRAVKKQLLNAALRNKLKTAAALRRGTGRNHRKGTRSGNRQQRVIDRAQKRAQKTQFTNAPKQNKQKHLI